jgi:hypothetical protein
MPVDLERISRIVDELEQLVPKYDAIVLVEQTGGGLDETSLRGTQAGYLRFAIELMKIGIAPEAEARKGLRPDLEYLIPDRSPIQFDWFERRDTSELQSFRQPQTLGWLAKLGCVAALLLFGIFALAALIVGISLMFPRGH